MKQLVQAELLRLRTTRMVYWLALATAAGVVLAVAASITTAGENGMAALATSEGVRNVMAAAASATTLVLFLSVLMMAGEFRHNTATATFLVTPNRGRVVTAKLIVSLIVGLLFAIGAALLTVAIGLPWMASKDVDVSLVSDDVILVLGAGIVATMLYGSIGIGVGALIRNQTAAVIVSVVWVMLVEGVLVNLTPAVGKWLPGGAASALTHTATPEGGLLPMWAGGFLLAAYSAIFALAATRFTIRRDVT